MRVILEGKRSIRNPPGGIWRFAFGLVNALAGFFALIFRGGVD
jgi:hypothetical protein